MTFSVCHEVMSTELIYFCGEIVILHINILKHEVRDYRQYIYSEVEKTRFSEC